MHPGATLTWEGVVCCLQNVLKTDLSVGGLTALELKGYSHYVALPNIEALPAVRWKMLNLGKMDKGKHSQALKNLDDILNNR